ncbi:undecaprenyl diphosphate synthase [Cardiosporidium cionae]|uniref:Alkyl transferase n=1 Tax=Cardiosporidium cionae TaxID=476202 RepID=A0ABQ7JA71_9APIC|nr:undecaprenyl diphosphate synthase [Cardiosporidium cionae]|eukprot:KAF8820895.1 undecaprenyl diphosphate synthase [Cardiosporidium cionae]
MADSTVHEANFNENNDSKRHDLLNLCLYRVGSTQFPSGDVVSSCKMEIRWWERWIMRLMHQCTTPRHIAFIMDGNRRFASKQLQPTPLIQGHVMGFETLTLILQVCLEMGIRYVTIFAFALSNFNRSKEEISDLFNLAEEKFNDTSWIDEFILRNDVCLRVAGDRAFWRPSFCKAVDEIVEKTKQCKSMTLVICIAYGGRYELSHCALKAFAYKETLLDSFQHEISSSLDENISLDCNKKDNEGSDCSTSTSLSFSSNPILSPFKARNFQVEEIPMQRNSFLERPLDNFLYSAGIPPPDILIRSSGETRLSDFLIYQCSEQTSFHFIDKLWPEITTLDVLNCIAYYQIFECSFQRASLQENSQDGKSLFQNF